MKKLFTIIILIPFLGLSQNNIKGVVKDKETGTLIEDAVVTVKPYRVSGAGYFSGLKTQKNGVFDLNTTYDYPLQLITTKKGCTSEIIKIKKGVSYVEVIIECDSESIKEIIRVQTSDVDGDGVLDKDDQCIDVAGSIENEGCPWPDNDNDGVADKDDTCPNEAGALDNKGCPWPDSDSDGVADKDDRCPDEAGTVLNKGCPALPTQLVEFIESDQNLILFAINSAALDTEDKTTLDKIKVLLEEYPKTMITVEGYASKDGSESYNQKLSEERAAAVKAYFVSKNIDVQRINTLGFGENRTVGDNNTMLGRKNSRRAKIRLNIQ